MLSGSRAPLPHGEALVLAVWVAGFGVGTVVHLIELLTQGAAVYGTMPAGVRVFWVSLTIVDPVLVVLLLLRVRASIWLGCAVMVVDVVVNWTAALTIPGATGPGLVTQPLFLLFLLTTAPLLWRSFRKPA
ncbi:hypothetical protein [Agromyces salentinus]|uniref:hypothetical protein n=1 Tax=Agromyces salentinus TaxID=269421 RepID=UPI0012F8F0F9|nr:hypothetical protein [Agromyces salentinus]